MGGRVCDYGDSLDMLLFIYKNGLSAAAEKRL